MLVRSQEVSGLLVDVPPHLVLFLNRSETSVFRSVDLCDVLRKFPRKMKPMDFLYLHMIKTHNCIYVDNLEPPFFSTTVSYIHYTVVLKFLER